MNDIEIIIFGSNPMDTGRIGIDRELRRIRDEFKRIGKSELIPDMITAVRLEDIQGCLLELDDNKKYIIQFSGHYEANMGLALHDENSNSHYISNSNFVNLLKLFNNIECVFINACNSVELSKQIGEYVKYVICIKGEISDEVASEFSVMFYRSIAYGKNIEFSYKFAHAAIDNKFPGERSIPILYKNICVVRDHSYVKNEPYNKNDMNSPGNEVYDDTLSGIRIQRNEPFSFRELLTIFVIFHRSHSIAARELEIDDIDIRRLLSGDKFNSNSMSLRGIKNKLGQNLCKLFDISSDKFNNLLCEPAYEFYRNISPDNKSLAQACKTVLDGYYASEDMTSIIRRALPYKESGSVLNDNELTNVYSLTGLNIPPSKMDQFARVSFSKLLWDRVIGVSQNLDVPDNHLHFSNILIAEWFTKIFFQRNPPERPIRILEGGVGGANTTYCIFSQLYDYWKNNRMRYPVDPNRSLNIEYLGFDINPAFTARVNDLINVETDSDDPRKQFFRMFRERSGKISKWPYQDAIVKSDNMATGIQSLIEDRLYFNTVHLFVSSYTMHHVAHGEYLKKYLFGDGVNGMTPIITHPGYAENFAHELLNVLNNKSYVPDEKFKAVSILAEYLGRYDKKYSYNISNDIQNFLKYERVKVHSKLPDSINDLFHDFQLELLHNVWWLLVPGGIVAIADPDGYSTFNAKNVSSDPEMSVAHFRKMDEMLLILKRAGFNILRYYKVGELKHVEDKCQKFGIVEPGVEFNDDNLGYVIIAQKPDKSRGNIWM